MTDWRNLFLIVNERALAADTEVEAQLAIAKIESTTPRAEAFEALKKSLKSPKPNETALEIPYRLILSPDCRAKWETPRHTPPQKGALLWHARLLEPTASSVRALWARGADEAITQFLDGTAPRDRNTDILTYSLSPADRRQLVILSSAYGLPALRPIKKKKVTEPDTGAADTQEPVQGSDNRNGTIVLPNATHSYLISNDTIQEGVWVPKPLDRANLILTPLGASFDLEWRGEPPAPAQVDGVRGWQPAVSIERWRHEAFLGRDVRVEVTFKGYLLPFGHGVSLVKMTERRFYRRGSVRTGTTTAYLIQRRFIVCSKPRKTFPALYQPAGGRGAPAQVVELLTRRTPDLLNPEDKNNGLANGRVDSKEPGLAFWPSTSDGNRGVKRVEFELQIDGNPTSAKCPLLFVENSIVHDRLRMKEIVEHYNAAAAVTYRTLRHGGASRRYAPSRMDGDTHFDTDRWILEATGKEGSDEKERYRMDSLMFGENQPPFYPVMRRAYVTAQTVDRLLGRPAGLIEVGVDPLYLASGFGSGNPAELYLDVYGPDIDLDFTSSGKASGGVAKPNGRLVALSRITGPVCGTGFASTTTANLVPTLHTGADDPPYKFDAAKAGNFSPTEFFGGTRAAKLLGVISLADVLPLSLPIDKAPALIETVSYKLGTATTAQAIAEEFGKSVEILIKAIERLRAEATDRAAKVGLADWRPFYRELDAKLTALSDQLRRSKQDAAKAAAETPPNLQGVITAISHLPGAGRPVLAEIERVARNPIPPAIQSQLQELQSVVEALRKIYLYQGKNFGSEIWASLARDLSKVCKELSATAPLLFGAEGNQCSNILANPRDALENVRDTLFYHVFGRSFSEAYLIAQRFVDEFEARIRLGRQELKSRFLAVLQAAPGLTTLPPAELDVLAEALTDAVVGHFSNAIFVPRNDEDRPGNLVEKALNDLTRKVAQSLAEEAAFLTAPQRNEITTRLVAVIRRDIEDQVAAYLRLFVERLEALKVRAAARVTQAVTKVFEGLIAAGELGSIANALRTADAWCAKGAGAISAVQKFGETIGTSLLADGQVLLDHIVKIEDDIKVLVVPSSAPVDVQTLVERARAGIAVASQQLTAALVDLHRARSQLVNASPVQNACTHAREFLLNLRDCITLRIIVTRTLREAADSAALAWNAISQGRRIVSQASPQWTAASRTWAASRSTTDFDAIEAALKRITAHLASLMQEVTSIGAIASNVSTWSEAKSLVAVLKARLSAPEFGGYLAGLSEEQAKLEAAARATASRLQSAKSDPAELVKLAGEVIAYAAERDRQFAAMVLKSVVAGGQSWQIVDDFVKAGITNVARLAIGVHNAALAALRQFKTALDTAPLSGLIHPELKKALDQAVTDIEGDVSLLDRVVASLDAVSAAAAAQRVVDKWKVTPPLVAAVEMATDVIDAFAKGQLSSIFDFGALQRELRNAIASLVPTRIDLAYDWDAPLSQFSDGLFVMAPKRNLPNGPKNDLVLEARISVDLEQNTRRVDVRGQLRPFDVNLMGDSKNRYLTIQFKEFTFTSRNGANPELSAPIENVIIGDKLSFVQKLQELLNPGSGLYVDPRPAEIEVGWRYASALIQLGSLQLINLAISISATLPLSQGEARFRFAFASQQKPFLIASPPYGGGGYVEIVAKPNGIETISASFECGAVTAINFAILDAQGRVTMGIYIQKSPDGAVIQGFVQAVGDGNIACFGVSIQLVVGLEQVSGNMQGFSRYRYSFRVGIADVSFEFEARYDVQGSSGASRPAIARAPALAAAFPKFKNGVPNKASQWNDYRSRFELDLLAT